MVHTGLRQLPEATIFLDVKMFEGSNIFVVFDICGQQVAVLTALFSHVSVTKLYVGGVDIDIQLCI